MIHHHPSADLLAEYAAGSLPMSQSLCVATHLENCATCRHEFERLNHVGAALFSELTPKSSSAADLQALKERLLSRLNEAAPVITEPAPKIAAEVPKALRQWVPDGYDALNWFRLTPSFKVFTLLKDKDGSQIALSRVKPGGQMGHHRHTGKELTVVLKGAFSDDSGLYKQGDFVVRDTKDRHRPIVTRDGECICLMVTAAPIQFTGRFTRWLNPLLRLQHG